MANINFDNNPIEIPCSDMVIALSGTANVSAVGDGTIGAVIALAPAGYSPLGITHFETSNVNFVFLKAQLNGANAEVDILNLSSSNQAGTLTIEATYIKDDYIS